jgi:hypothetical protein
MEMKMAALAHESLATSRLVLEFYNERPVGGGSSRASLPSGEPHTQWNLL